jgi:hypothetical protein
MSFKNAYDVKGLNEETKKKLEKTSSKNKAFLRGGGLSAQIEPVPGFILGDCEKVFDNRANYQNSAIVLGKDRPRSLLSGYGGRGDTQASSIDIVAGYQGVNAIETNGAGEKVYINPDFFKDAARIYISQKTDIDENFALAPGSLGSPGLDGADKIPKSGIALKADNVRVIAREGIKLVTGTDTKNSQGGKVFGYGGIDLIAGNNSEDLQPLAKGDNLVEALNRIVHHVNKLSGIVDAFCTHQKAFNAAVSDHVHISPFQAQPTLPSQPVQFAGKAAAIDLQSQVLRAITLFKTNLGNFELSYLKQSGEKYINSRFNNTN